MTTELACPHCRRTGLVIDERPDGQWHTTCTGCGATGPLAPTLAEARRIHAEGPDFQLKQRGVTLTFRRLPPGARPHRFTRMLREQQLAGSKMRAETLRAGGESPDWHLAVSNTFLASVGGVAAAEQLAGAPVAVDPTITDNEWELRDGAPPQSR